MSVLAETVQYDITILAGVFYGYGCSFYNVISGISVFIGYFVQISPQKRRM